MRSIDADRIQDMVISAKKEGKSIEIANLMEITDDLPIDQVVWYYNNVPGKRYDIEKMYFDRFKTYQEWYEVYKASRPKDPTLMMSLSMIFKKAKTIRMLLEIYDVDFNDELLRKSSLEKIIERGAESFDNWLFIYDESIFDEKLNHMALKKCLRYATTMDHWQKIYDRSEIGSSMQIKAIQKLYGKIHISEKEIQHKEIKTAAHRSQAEYISMYEAETFGSAKKENILVNKYLSADHDLSAPEKGGH